MLLPNFQNLGLSLALPVLGQLALQLLSHSGPFLQVIVFLVESKRVFQLGVQVVERDPGPRWREGHPIQSIGHLQGQRGHRQAEGHGIHLVPDLHLIYRIILFLPLFFRDKAKYLQVAVAVPLKTHTHTWENGHDLHIKKSKM